MSQLKDTHTAQIRRTSLEVLILDTKGFLRFQRDLFSFIVINVQNHQTIVFSVTPEYTQVAR